MKSCSRLAFCLSAVLALLGSGCRSVSIREGIAFPPAFEKSDVETFRVLAWNMRHFVDPYDSPYIRNEWDDSLEGMSEERIELFVKALRAINADVVILEEFESAAYLESLARERFEDLGYIGFTEGGQRTWHQNVVVMSRFPLGPATTFGSVRLPIEGAVDKEGNPDSQTLTNHRLLGVEVFVDADYEFHLYALHLKAGGGPRNEGWRRGQIDYLLARMANVLDQQPEANFLVAGDFNATPDSEEIRHLIAEGPFVDALAGSEVKTMTSSDPQRRIDYVLPNDSMGRELVPGSTHVPAPLNREEMIVVSDHLPMVADFRASDR